MTTQAVRVFEAEEVENHLIGLSLRQVGRRVVATEATDVFVAGWTIHPATIQHPIVARKTATRVVVWTYRPMQNIKLEKLHQTMRTPICTQFLLSPAILLVAESRNVDNTTCLCVCEQIDALDQQRIRVLLTHVHFAFVQFQHTLRVSQTKRRGHECRRQCDSNRQTQKNHLLFD